MYAFGSNWSWNQLDAAAREFYHHIEGATDAVAKARAINGEDIAQANRIFRRILTTAADWLRDRPGTPVTQSIAYAVRLAQITSDEILALIPTDTLPPVLIPILASSLTPNGGPPVRADQFIAALLNDMQVIAAMDLVAGEAEIASAAEKLAMLAAEVVYGVPIVRAGSSELKILNLPLSDVQQTMHAIRAAHHILGRRDMARAAVSNSRADPATNHPGADAKDATAKAPDDHAKPAIDLTLLIAEASSLSTDIERMWSDALKVVNDWAKPASEKWASVIAAMISAVNERSHTINSNNLNDRLPADPLPASDAAKIHPDATGQQQMTQSLLAEICIVKDLLRAMRGLREPTAQAVDIESGRILTWWEMGGFSLTRDVGVAAIRMENELDALANGTKVDADQQVLQYLSLSQNCADRGYYEGALIYLGLVANLSKTVETARRLLNADEFTRISDLALRLSSGEPPKLGTIIPLVRYWLDQITRTLYREQAAIRAAIKEAGDGA